MDGDLQDRSGHLLYVSASTHSILPRRDSVELRLQSLPVQVCTSDIQVKTALGLPCWGTSEPFYGWLDSTHALEAQLLKLGGIIWHWNLCRIDKDQSEG